MSGGSSKAPKDESGPYYEFLAEQGRNQYEIWKQEFLPLDLQQAQLSSDDMVYQRQLQPIANQVQRTSLEQYLGDAQTYDQYGRPASQAGQQYARDYYDVAREGLDVTRGQNDLARQAQGLQGDYLDYQGNVLDSMGQELGVRDQYRDYQSQVLEGQQGRLGQQQALQSGQLGLQQQALAQEQGLQAGRGELAQLQQGLDRRQFGLAAQQQDRAGEASVLQQQQIAARGEMLGQAGPDYDYVTQRAAADYDAAQDRAMGIQQRQLQQAGVDPTSGRWQQTMARNFAGQRAAGINAAREQERNAAFNRLNQATSDYRGNIGYGVNQQGTGYNPASQGPGFNPNIAQSNFTLPGVATSQALPSQGTNIPQRPTNSAGANLGISKPQFDNGLGDLQSGASGLGLNAQRAQAQANQQAAGRGRALGTVGTAVGSVWGPVGGAVGGAIGGILGGFAEGGMPAARQQRMGLVSGQAGIDQVPAQVENGDGSLSTTSLSNNEFVLDAETVEGIVRQFMNQKVAGLQKRLV